MPKLPTRLTSSWNKPLMERLSGDGQADRASALGVIIAVDPGASGAVAVFTPGERVVYHKTPTTERDTWDLFEQEALTALKHNYRITAYVEVVGGYIGSNPDHPGSNPAPGSAMFKFGVGYGGLRMAIIGNHIRLIDVRPQTWMAAFSIPPRKKSEGSKGKTAWKNRLKAKAQQLFPDEKVTLQICDALLIGDYAVRKEMGLL